MTGLIKNVLLLDTAFAAVPIHDFLVASDLDVWTIGNRANDPLALAYPDRWVQGDYSNVEAVRSVIDQLSIDAVVPGCTDVSMATFVATGVKGPYRYSAEADAILNTKNLFRKLCAELDLPSPRIVTQEQLPRKERLICKPVDSFSGRGVSIFDASDASATLQAFSTARRESPTAQVICEEFVEGQLYSYSSFLKDGRVDVAFVVREGSRYNPQAVDTSYVIDWTDDARTQILKLSVEKCANHLELCDGLVHVQFIANESKLAIVEITRRCPGDLYSLLVEYSTGFPFASRYASYFVGKPIRCGHAKKRHILRHTVKQPGGARFNGLNLDVDLNIRRIVPVWRTGENIDGSGFQRTGLIFAEENTPELLRSKYEHLIGCPVPQVSSPSREIHCAECEEGDQARAKKLPNSSTAA
jgi:ATP-grasp domain